MPVYAVRAAAPLVRFRRRCDRMRIPGGVRDTEDDNPDREEPDRQQPESRDVESLDLDDVGNEVERLRRRDGRARPERDDTCSDQSNSEDGSAENVPRDEYITDAQSRLGEQETR